MIKNTKAINGAGKMIRPEKYQFNWKPKTKSKEDLGLVKDLNLLVKELNINKTQLTRLALIDFVTLTKKLNQSL